MIGAGIANLASLPTAFVMIGGGFLLLAVGMLCFLLMKWGFGTVLPWAFGMTWSAVCRLPADTWKGVRRRMKAVNETLKYISFLR